jgi:precorrin-6B methylase 2
MKYWKLLPADLQIESNLSFLSYKSIQMPNSLFLFLLTCFLMACDASHQPKGEQNSAFSPEKLQFLTQINLYQEGNSLKYQLDSAGISSRDIIHFCQVSFDIDKKTTLIQVIRSAVSNDLKEENHEYWAGILYDLRRFIENVSLLKTRENKVFMDVGSGNGEKLYAALCLGFQKAIGIEYSTDLMQISEESLKDFVQNKEIELIHGDALEVSKDVYAEADFIYLYSPIKDNQVMAQLTHHIMQSMKENAILLEVRFVYRDELAKISGLELPDMAGLFALKKQKGRFYYAEYDQHETKWRKLQ